MLTIIIFFTLLPLIAFIVNTIRAKSRFRTINSKGISVESGTYESCERYAESQNDFCSVFGIDDHFIVVK